MELYCCARELVIYSVDQQIGENLHKVRLMMAYRLSCRRADTPANAARRLVMKEAGAKGGTGDLHKA